MKIFFNRKTEDKTLHPFFVGKRDKYLLNLEPKYSSIVFISAKCVSVNGPWYPLMSNCTLNSPLEREWDMFTSVINIKYSVFKGAFSVMPKVSTRHEDCLPFLFL